MKLILLGKSRSGKKSFALLAADQFGYNITCKDKANFAIHEWLFSYSEIGTLYSKRGKRSHRGRLIT